MMGTVYFSFKTALCLYVVYFVCAYNITDEDQLHKDLFTNYNNELRAGNDRDFPLNVSMTFYLMAIKEFVEATSKFSVNGVFSITWRDERLSWNPAMYQNIQQTMVSQNKIWLPTMIISNPFKEAHGLGSDLVKIYLFSDGSCVWIIMQSFEVICDANVKYYPFDKQFCSLRFGTYGFDRNWLNITFPTSKIGMIHYEENGLWEIENTAAYCTADHGPVEVVFELYMKRRSTYYVASLLVPMTFVAVLQSFVFLLPNESGERIGFSVTMLLASVVFLTLIQEKLPESSEPSISILGYLLLGYITLGGIQTLAVILSSNFFIQTKPVPKWLKIISCQELNKVEDKPPRNKSEENSVKELDDDSLKEKYEVCWRKISRSFDRVCFILSLIVFAIQISIYIAMVYI
ncbi:acetylcholine receptor subunit beta-type unc-29-like [Crassostrea angulata]|uniref:acetylcholine receptor subunit beta-type unc-29-like n=1 Tax=Magallana angulata TaxID=2784310 RepID=UPI0022B19D99|nr:acetylcholine receptor subunit beta-type unc-29-like [Crassostrea angulata]